MTAQRIASLVEDANNLYRDYDLSSVKAWKAKTGGMAIGFMPIYVPRELLHAQGVLPVGIMGGGDDLEIIRGDAYYQSYICHIPRSTIELGLGGKLDCLDGMLFPAICDVIRNLSGMWKLEFPDKLSRYLDVPQDFTPEMGGSFYKAELIELCEDLESRGAKPFDAEALKASIKLYNGLSDIVRELYQMRRDEPWLVPTAELYCLQRAATIWPVEEATKHLTEYRDLVRGDETRQPMDQARVILAGSFCEQPPLGLIKTLERSGCYIVDDDFVQVHRWLTDPVSTEGDPLDALVDSFLHRAMDSPTRFCGDVSKGTELVDRVEAAAAEGVLFCAPSFCDPALLDQPMAVKSIEAAGIPWTAFLYAENNGQFQVIREQAGTFADSIKLWTGV